MPLDLPKPIVTYLDAVRKGDADLFDLCFANDANVHDENRDYRGLDAIKAWKREAEAKYQYTAEPLDANVDGKAVRVHLRLTGDFPGSPIELDYEFMLENGKIASLVID